MQEMQAGDDAGGLDLVQHLHQVRLAVRIFRPVVIIAVERVPADLLEDRRVIEQHQAKAAFLGVGNVLVDVGRIDMARPVGGRVDQVAAAAFDAPGQIEICLDLGNRIEQPVRCAGDQGRARPLELDITDGVSAHDAIAFAPLRVDPGVGRCRQHVDRHLAVPADIQPLAEMFPVAYGQLEQTQFRDGRRRHHEPAVIRRADDKVHQAERDVCRRFPDRDDRLVRNDLEADDQPVSLAAQPVGLKRRPFVRMGQLDLVVERPFLGDRKQGDFLTGRQAFLTRRLVNQAFRQAVAPDNQPHLFIFKNNVLYVAHDVPSSPFCLPFWRVWSIGCRHFPLAAGNKVRWLRQRDTAGCGRVLHMSCYVNSR